MENSRFDDLTKRLATGTSRRRLLTGLAGGGLALGVAARATGGRAAACPSQNATQCAQAGGVFSGAGAGGVCTVTATGGSRPSACNPNFTVTAPATTVFTGQGANCQSQTTGGEVTACTNPGGHPVTNEHAFANNCC